MDESAISEDVMTLSNKFNVGNLEKTLGNESERKEKEEICLGYFIRYKE